jgi:DNA-binding GntR family transcriptional regulator
VTPLVVAADVGAAGAAYREIKRRIIEGEHKPGAKLSEVRLSAQLGIGRSPIRTALARLQGEGWIEISPQSGTYVKGLSAKAIADVLEIRLVLETYVAGVAAKRVTETTLKKLRAAFDAFGPTVTSDRVAEYLELDLAVHLAIYEAAGNALIAQDLLNLIDKVRWIRRRSTASPLRLQEAYEEIGAVLRALEARDAAAAGEAMRRHIQAMIDFRRDLDADPIVRSA